MIGAGVGGKSTVGISENIRQTITKYMVLLNAD